MTHRLQDQNAYLTSWVTEAGRGHVYPPPQYHCVWQSNIVIQTNNQNHLLMRHAHQRTLVELGRFVGDIGRQNSFFLLNGDGFTAPEMQRVQGMLREQVNQNLGAPRENTHRRIIIPYQALNSARLELDSIRVIHASRDRNLTQLTQVPKPPPSVLDKHVASNNTLVVHFEHLGRRYESRWEYGQRNMTDRSGHHERGSFVYVLHRPEFSPNESWFRVTNMDADQWHISIPVHQLGATVFRARGADGTIHRWLSGFDQNEPRPLYFLAQLPDRGGVRYYTHALRLLAPKIVHQARAEGRSVFRQGDIFAIATELTDEDLADATITNRSHVMNSNGIPFRGDNDAVERRARQRRRNLMIYGTSHTATVVAVTDRGTFVQGTMHHDPVLENIRRYRQPDHRDLPLTPGVWFLCVRNSVPRQTTNDTGGRNASPDSMPNVQGNQRARRGVSEPVVS